MRYTTAFDIWQIPADLRRYIQPGQWVYAGSRDTKGRYLGQTAGGVDVCAWLDSSRLHRRKVKVLRTFAKAHS
jgi:hypothetical protein